MVVIEVVTFVAAIGIIVYVTAEVHDGAPVYYFVMTWFSLILIGLIIIGSLLVWRLHKYYRKFLKRDFAKVR